METTKGNAIGMTALGAVHSASYLKGIFGVLVDMHTKDMDETSANKYLQALEEEMKVFRKFIAESSEPLQK
jgi:hypothetical protein